MTTLKFELKHAPHCPLVFFPIYVHLTQNLLDSDITVIVINWLYVISIPLTSPLYKIYSVANKISTICRIIFGTVGIGLF